MSSIVLKGSTSGTVTLQPAATISPNVTFILPSTDGSAGQVLATNGSGTLSFITNDGSASYQAANSAGSYANGAFTSANTADQKGVSAGSYANSAFGVANSASSYANGAFAAANTADQRAVTSGDYANSAFAKANTLFNATAVIHANTITANTISSINLVSSNTVVANNVIISGILDVDGVQLVWHAPPTTSKGSSGDVAGLIAIDNDKLYRCVGTYDGTTDIWRFINFTGGTWG
jgi:hypothetical protein